VENNSSRRSFLGQATMAGSAFIAGSHNAKAKTKRKKPTVELMSIGTIAVGDASHMNYEAWPPMINGVIPNAWPVGRTSEMLITHVWDSRPDVAVDFAKKYSCESVKNYYDMTDKVDAMIFAGFHECKWWPQLTKPYLEAGIPCFINRPFAYSMKDAKQMVETARKYNTPILCSDSHEYMQQVPVARYKIDELLGQGRKLIGAHSTNPCVEYPGHGIHGLYYLLAVLGLDVELVSFQADGWWHEITPASKNLLNYGQLSLLYRGIETEGGKKQVDPFLVSQLLAWPRADITLRLYHDLGWWDINHPHTHSEGESPYNRLFYMFFNSILAMQQMFLTRTMPQSYEYLLKKTKIFLAGFKSHLEHDGKLIPVDDLPDDWEAPYPYPDWIDESIFS